MKCFKRNLAAIFIAMLTVAVAAGQAVKTVEEGSSTAKNGFKNETEIAAKFNDWQNDADARKWLAAMGFDVSDILTVVAAKPHGDKADVVVNIKTGKGDFREGVSIKLVSSTTGFNQIDKRWLAQYAKKWNMPDDLIEPMKKYLGEIKPEGETRRPDRMFITEFDKETQEKIVSFFAANKDLIISDLLEGDGYNRAKWFMVAWKKSERPEWKIVSTGDAVKFFGEGKVEITRQGNLKIGRISMQRKGGDGGRETANMLQFKLNPALIFEMK